MIIIASLCLQKKSHNDKQEEVTKEKKLVGMYVCLWNTKAIVRVQLCEYLLLTWFPHYARNSWLLVFGIIKGKDWLNLQLIVQMFVVFALTGLTSPSINSSIDNEIARVS